MEKKEKHDLGEEFARHMTKREYFATHCPDIILRGLVSINGDKYRPHLDEYAREALRYADKMIAELEERKK